MKHLLLLLPLLSPALAYRILCISPMPSRSHSTLAKGIVDPLLKAGHEVIWLTPYTDWKPHKNLRLLDGSASLSHMDPNMKMTDMGDMPHSFLKEFSNNLTSETIQNKALREVLVKEKLDAVVTEWFFSDTDAGYAATLGVPWILLSGMIMSPHMENYVEDVRSVSTIPIVFNDYPIPMTFVQRLSNALMYFAMWSSMQLDFPSTAARYESYFAPIAAARGVPLPPLSAVHTNVSILLVNSHPAVSPAMSLPPNAVEIAGYHIDEAQAVPKEIQEILDKASKGVVYFSMGSVLKSTMIPIETRQAIVDILGSIPYTVLWKFEEDIQGLPKNIIVRKWWPQAGVLAHPNIKLFITHGGLLSTLEAVRFGVPLLAIPVFGDQPSNAARAVRSGYAKKVPFGLDMGPELKTALNEMLADDSYYKQAKYLSKLFNNRPVHPSKLITHYIELAIESQGAFHLRSKSHFYPWYQRWMLDQIALLLAILITICAVLRKIVCKFFCKEKDGSKKLKKN